MASYTEDIHRLVALVGLPTNPNGCGDDWAPVERRLSLEFPVEYKQLVRIFGTGPWADFVHVLSPFATNGLDLEHRALRKLGAIHRNRREYPNQVPFAVFPEPLGLFPWALTDNGDTLCWLTEGYRWQTVVYSAREPDVEVHQLSSAALILAFLEGTLKSPCLIEPFEGVPPVKQHHW
jgi:hypothetical protein